MKFSVYATIFGLAKAQLPGPNAGWSADGHLNAAQNKDVPPFTTTAAVAGMKGTMLFEQFAKASNTGYPVRGEKNWQAWAGDMEDFGDM